VPPAKLGDWRAESDDLYSPRKHGITRPRGQIADRWERPNLGLPKAKPGIKNRLHLDIN